MADTTIARPAAHSPPSQAQIQQARKLFDQGRKACASDSHRFAIHAFADAVRHDPGQRQYAKELLAVLSSGVVVGPGVLATAWSVWRLNRKLAQAVATANWQLALESGTLLLSLRPSSISALLALGQTCAELRCLDSALVYLRHAHKLRPHDILVNRYCGRALGKVSQFDEAICCWQVVQQRSPRDEEALRAIGNLAAKKLF